MAKNEGASAFDPGTGDNHPLEDHPVGERRESFPPARLQPAVEVEQRVITKPARTSAAAAFALIFGVAALLSVLTVILSPVGLVLGVIGLILGLVGIRMARRTGITGKGVAIGGLVLSLLAVLASVTIAVGATTVLNNDTAVNRLQHQVDKLRDKLPGHVTVPKT